MVVPRRPTRAAEPLEPRTLLAAAAAPAPSPALDAGPTVRVVIDYSLDDNHFFDTQFKKDLLQQAADSVVKWFKDDLLAITPGGGDTWEAVFDDPATGGRHTSRNLSLGAGEVLLFAGGRDMPDALGRGGPGGYNASGSTGWLDRVGRRGQGGGGANSAEFGPWGGAITFDTDPASPWNFSQTTAGLSGANDFFSVASHEVAHLMGFGTSDAWRQFVSGGAFAGRRSLTQYDVAGASGVPLNDGEDHWAEGTRDGGQEVSMDPQLTVGTRRLLTPLDFAALDDVGWSMPPRAALSAGVVADAGAAPFTFTVNYTHYAAIDAASFGPDDLSVLGPDGAALAASFVSAAGAGADRTATYSLAAPGGSWDAADNGTYAIVLQPEAVRSTTGEAVAAGTLGSFAVDVSDPPRAELQPTPEPAPGATGQSFNVVYSDGVGVDPVSIDAADVVVTAPDGTALPASSLLAVDSTTPGTPLVATYAVAAPGGSWGPEDDGRYTVSLRPGAVRDTSGNASVGGAIGTFDVSLGAEHFDARTPATYTDASGDVVVVTLKGPGTGLVRFAGARPSDASAIELHGTTAASTLVIKSGRGGTSVGGISTDGALRSVTGKLVDLAGSVSVTGWLGKLLLRNAGGGAVVLGAGPATSLSFAAVSDLAIDSGAPIKTLKVAQWLEGEPGSRDAVLAPAVGSIVSRGDFAADVTTSSLGTLSVGGALTGSDVRAGARIGKVTAGSARDSRLFAGVRPGLSTLPTGLADFSDPAAVIAAVTIRSKGLGGFSNTLIAAPTIGRLSLGAIESVNGGTPLGVAADRITALTGIAVGSTGALRQTRLDDPAGSFVAGDFAVALV